MGPIAAGGGQAGQATDPLVSSFMSRNKQHGRLFVGWTDASDDIQTSTPVQVPHVPVSV